MNFESAAGAGVIIFFLIFRRADEFFVIADVFKGTSAKSSENEKNADVDSDPSEKRSDVEKILKIRPA